MFRRNPINQSHQRNKNDWNVKENPDACYECGRTGHIKKYCPQLRNKTAGSNSRDFKEKKFKSRKALLTWDDSDESDKEGSEDEDVAQLCFMANDDDPKHNDIWLWHRRLGHVHMDLIKKLLSKDLVRGLPNLKFIKDKVCDACQYGKQSKTSFHAKSVVSTSRTLQLFHLDLFGPTRNASLGGKFYAFVIVDDFSRYTWVLFLTRKDEAFENFFSLVKQLQNEELKLVKIRSDHGGEFEKYFILFCIQNGISHEFSAPQTPQQNGVVERKNRTLQEIEL
ncbi:hypothetical protein RJ640_030390 [Escallonia rubra]|uniref:Retrovirus-related Pol polyprotein from transposon TNT 1-94 n=1 Tax=Escallonia rubra TaxID=112253 RepID=A0AA88RGS5_9ASTE|nr:hypothetical protein RJ640_030390 [Escallonia rubra]